jgi:hypothetical protein
MPALMELAIVAMRAIFFTTSRRSFSDWLGHPLEGVGWGRYTRGAGTHLFGLSILRNLAERRQPLGVEQQGAAGSIGAECWRCCLGSAGEVSWCRCVMAAVGRGWASMPVGLDLQHVPVAVSMCRAWSIMRISTIIVQLSCIRAALPMRTSSC